MSKKTNRKQKWRNITLNKANIDEYLQDLYNGTSGNYITQGVSFNKDDNFQMSLLRNALISSGSFSGLVKDLLYAHFEKHGKLDDTIWQPNEIVEEELGDYPPSSPPPTEQNEDEQDPVDPVDPTGVNEVTATTEETEKQSETKQQKERKQIPPTTIKDGQDNIVKKRISNFSR